MNEDTKKQVVDISKMNPEILYQTMCEVYSFIAIANLTQNKYHALRKEEHLNFGVDGNFDDLFERFLFTACSDDQKYLIEKLSRKNIIDLFSSGENEISFELRRKNAKGEFVWVELRGIKLENANLDTGDVWGIIILREIGNSLNSEQWLQRKYAPMLKGMHNVIALYKITSDNIFLIGASPDYFEFAKSTKKYVDMRQGLFHDEVSMSYYRKNQEALDGIFKKAALGEKISYVHSIEGKNDKTLWIKIEASKIDEHDGCPIYFAFLVDVTEQRVLQMELELERERYKLAIEVSDDAIFEYDIANDVFCAYGFGSGLEDYIAPYISKFHSVVRSAEYIHPDDVNSLLSIVCDGRDGVVEFRTRRHASNEYRWFRARSGARIVEKGKAVRVVGTFCDIDDLKRIKLENTRLQESEEFLNNALNKIVSDDYDYIICIDSENNGKYRLLYNGSGDFSQEDSDNIWRDSFTEKFMEYLQKESLPEDTAKLIPAVTLERIKTALERRNEYVLYFRIPKGIGIAYKQLYFSYFNSSKGIILLTCTDITKLREEEAYAKQVLMDALHNAQLANNTKTEFLSQMSHDSRTLLNAIIGITDIAKEKPVSLEEFNDYFEKINVSSNYLLSLINDILDVTQIETGRMMFDVQRFSMEKFLQEILAIIHPQAIKKGIDFTIVKGEELASLYFGDYLRINQILINLISNSLRFTSSGGTIKLKVSSRKIQDDVEEVVFVVADTGIGMSKEFMRGMYDPFERENSREKLNSEAGSGLGLAIVKNLTDLMGGVIEVESEPGKGTIFTVKLPLSLSQEIPIETKDVKNVANENHQALIGKQILLVEDNELNREICKTLLEFKGIIVDTAENGKVALEKFTACNEGTYSAILMDIQMPVMNGLETTAKIRELSRTDARKIPIIALTANAFETDKYKAQEVGMTAYLTKPLDKEALYRLLSES